MPIRLFSSDLDGTLAGDRDASRRFASWWNALPLSTRPLLVYNSGRLLEDIAAFVPEQGLPEPDYVIGGVGTMISGGESGLAERYTSELGAGFDRARVADILGMVAAATLQPERYQHAHKSSWFLHDASEAHLRDINEQFRVHGLDVKLIYSSNRDLDVLPRGADKGEALRWLCGRLDIPLEQVVVAGDTGNDSSMFLLPGVHGIMPSNARAELTILSNQTATAYQARQATADGVIEGLMRLGVGEP